ncbi:glycosyltransferase family 4 protein, partial [Pontibacter qinzhouensis]
AEQLQVSQYITWLGEINQEQALKEYQNCDAFVLPSLYESMGIVYIEALACGKPIIATKCGGPESTVTPFNGLLIEKENVTKLASALHYMIENRDKYDSNQIRQDFLARYSAGAVVPQLMALYKQVLEKHPGIS